jgi:hypothetical protein
MLDNTLNEATIILPLRSITAAQWDKIELTAKKRGNSGALWTGEIFGLVGRLRFDFEVKLNLRFFCLPLFPQLFLWRGAKFLS